MNTRHIGLLVGGIFSLGVIALLAFGHLSTSSTPQNFRWETPPVLYVCDTAPAWAKPETADFKKAIAYWVDHGYAFSAVESGPCVVTCKASNSDATPVCNQGKVTLDMADKWAAEDQAGICYTPTGVKELSSTAWATILVPAVLTGAPDAQSLTLAHEVGHCLAGLEHNQGPSLWFIHLSAKTGNIMNPLLSRTGWDDEGLGVAAKQPAVAGS